MCAEHEVELEFLPPYSPDFNPIEESFAELKHWIKKNRELTSEFESYGDYLELGLQHMSLKAGKHFKSAYIIMED